jgi:hypothetical protein
MAAVVLAAAVTVPLAGIASAQGMNCDHFLSQEAAQAVLDADGSDPNGLDEDDDGVACEALASLGGGNPTAGTPTATTATETTSPAETETTASTEAPAGTGTTTGTTATTGTTTAPTPTTVTPTATTAAPTPTAASPTTPPSGGGDDGGFSQVGGTPPVGGVATGA